MRQVWQGNNLCLGALTRTLSSISFAISHTAVEPSLHRFSHQLARRALRLEGCYISPRGWHAFVVARCCFSHFLLTVARPFSNKPFFFLFIRTLSKWCWLYAHLLSPFLGWTEFRLTFLQTASMCHIQNGFQNKVALDFVYFDAQRARLLSEAGSVLNSLTW